MDTSGLLTIAIVVLVVVGMTLARNVRSQSILDQWARANGLTIVNASQSLFFKGPYTLMSSRDQSVYRITVQDAGGNVRTGWARCGSWLFGLASSNVDVRWD